MLHLSQKTLGNLGSSGGRHLFLHSQTGIVFELIVNLKKNHSELLYSYLNYDVINFYERSKNCETRLLAPTCLSVRPQSLEGFVRNRMFKYYSKICRKIS